MEDPGPPVFTPGQGPTPVVDCKGNVCHVPAGPFCMGCYKAVDGDCNSDEYPFHEVNVPAFDIDQHEIRVDQYKGTTHCSQQAGDHPVVCITHGEASGHCTGRGNGWRLCTESEWEKAARGTDGRKYPWGNEIHGCDEAVYSGCNCSGGSCPVGSKPAGASPYGVMDMGGNVWEWVEDCYHQTYDGAPADGTAWATACYPDGSVRVDRGGGFYNYADYLRSSNRAGYDHFDDALGARCCRSSP
jgi:formylglycine-generating enzyme required for sulfatase activity